MDRGCFVWTPTPPLEGRRTPRPGPVRVCVLALLGRVGRAGVPGAFWCASPFPLAVLSFCFAWPPPGWGCPRLGPFFALPSAFAFCFFFSFLRRCVSCAPFVSCFLWFPAPGALGIGAVCCLFCWPRASRLSLCSRFLSVAWPLAALWRLPPPPPFLSRCCCRRSVPCYFFFSFFFFLWAPPLSPAFSGFRPRVPWALALCFVCFGGLRLPGSPCAVASFVCPAWPLASPWWLLPSPPPPFVSRSFCRCRAVLLFFFFSCCVVRPCCLWLSLVSGPGCLGPRRCAFFALLASRFSALRALSPLSCFPPGRWLLPGGCCPPLPFCLAVFVAAAWCCVPCAVLCCVSLGVVLRGAAARCAARCCAVV